VRELAEKCRLGADEFAQLAELSSAPARSADAPARLVRTPPTTLARQ